MNPVKILPENETDLDLWKRYTLFHHQGEFQVSNGSNTRYKYGNNSNVWNIMFNEKFQSYSCLATINPWPYSISTCTARSIISRQQSSDPLKTYPPTDSKRSQTANQCKGPVAWPVGSVLCHLCTPLSHTWACTSFYPRVEIVCCT